MSKRAKPFYQICKVRSRRHYVHSRNVVRSQEIFIPMEFFDANWRKVTETQDKAHAEQYAQHMAGYTGQDIRVRTILKI